ncbi:MAG: nicotinate-nucleotide--dimethylbenzimidazole phosphoribosyltransferase [Bermanella sp.]|jgi:nicotinate-nucleotide--dimethylbenzimidazole phosphoribosyltransferase
MWFKNKAAKIQMSFTQQATEHQLTLTKPPGALGALENVAITLAAHQGMLKPALDNIFISVFAADHGVAKQGVSAFPQAVTAEMIKNFASGGAAISVLAKQLSANFEVVNLGTVFDVPPHERIIDAHIANGTEDFSIQSAMSEDQLQQALAYGQQAAVRAKQSHSQLFIGGEMGIGNTTSASALASAYLNIDAINMVGCGTGLDASKLPYKAQVIEQALALHISRHPMDILKNLGGFEIVALVGAYIQCAQQGTTVLVDGFISSTAALLAVAINDSIRPWLMFSHESAEPGHGAILSALNALPLLNIGMRLGEGSGAAVTVSLMQSAVALHNQMATFKGAGVSEKE